VTCPSRAKRRTESRTLVSGGRATSLSCLSLGGLGAGPDYLLCMQPKGYVSGNVDDGSILSARADIRNGSLTTVSGEMISQTRDFIENLFRQRRIGILNVGQEATADIFDLLQTQAGLLDLSHGGNHDPCVCPNELTC
jgi:hypothetical protein